MRVCSTVQYEYSILEERERERETSFEEEKLPLALRRDCDCQPIHTYVRAKDFS